MSCRLVSFSTPINVIRKRLDTNNEKKGLHSIHYKVKRIFVDHPQSAHNPPPKPKDINRWKARLQAMANRYFGLNTVQMNKCVRKIVQATITARRLADVNKDSSAIWPVNGDGF